MLRKLTLAAIAALIATPSVASAQMSPRDIVSVAVQAGTFKTLATALDAAGLVSTLQGAGPFTVFAPTDEAFAKLPAGTVEALLKDKAALTRVLTYHVVAGKFGAQQVAGLSEAPTLAGIQAPIRVKDGAVWVGGARVITTDIQASNGIIHVLDAVMLPPSK